jgi:antitoxin VapB
MNLFKIEFIITSPWPLLTSKERMYTLHIYILKKEAYMPTTLKVKIDNSHSLNLAQTLKAGKIGNDRTMARVFKSGKSQAVRLPKEFRVESKELIIFRRGQEIVLLEPQKDMARAFDLLTELPDDFLADHGQEPPQDRDEL